MMNHYRYHALIADDDRDMTQMLAVRFQQIGFVTTEVHDGLSVVRAVEEGTPTILCLDVDMPFGDGLAICEMLSGMDSVRDVPVIILTGNESPDTVRRCHHLCAYFVPKRSGIWADIEVLVRELVPELNAVALDTTPVISP